MNVEEFDYLVIGGGSGGYAAARTAHEVGQRVAVVDGGAELGGLCILRGCMPSKTLLHVAEVAYQARHGEKLGLKIPQVGVDMAAVQARKKDIIAEFTDYRRGQLEDGRFALYRESARFVEERTVELSNGQRLRGRHVMIATGSVVSTPPIPGLAGLDCWTSDEVLNLDFLPERAIFLGGGIVACELAQFLQRVGCQVVLIQRSAHLLSGFDPRAARVIEEQLEEEGVELHTGTHITQIHKENGEFRVAFTSKKHGAQEVSAPHLVNALGRQPNTASLDLAKTGVKTDSRGRILCDAKQRTSHPQVWACGDVCGPHEIVHLAILQGELAAREATGRATTPIKEEHLVSICFTDPQVAVAGLTRSQLEERGLPFCEADYPFDDHGKSLLMEATRGHVRVFAHRETGQILGAECVGKDGGELIHSLAVAITLGTTAQELLRVQWYHPTLSEIWTYPLEDLVEDISPA